MKKGRIIFILFFVSVSPVVFGQDVIITKDAKKIEAKVLEVNASDIKYKLFYYPDGPVYTMPKQNIASIIYQNGHVDTFADTTSPNSMNSSNPENRLIVSNFMNLTDDQQEEYLKQYDPEFYERFRRGQKAKITSNTCFALGVFGMLIGGGMIIANNTSDGLNVNLDVALGLGFFVAGNVIIIPGIVCSISGAATKRSVQNAFREKYLGETQPKGKGQFQLQLSGNGIGVAYVF